ncbi:recombinase family protein [Cryptosporangium sp. NPDC051539]|uniref:recombinase family protein n=1 Tax=Cryptosporangium sp. NPDC051539 TaxID=3363962 RepID=UPI0037B6E383
MSAIKVTIGYGRVSKRDQNPNAQRDLLTTAGCTELFIDKASGKLASRPELDAAMRHLRENDVLVITRLDRLGRSVITWPPSPWSCRTAGSGCACCSRASTPASPASTARSPAPTCAPST